MDEVLEFCLLEFVRDQRKLHDDKRRMQEEVYQSQLGEMKIKEEKLLYEQKTKDEQIEKKLTLYKQQTDDLKAEIKQKVKHQLRKHYDSKTQYMEDIISAKKTEYHKWIKEKQQAKSNISDENELLKFNQTFIIEEEKKKKYLQDLSETTRKQLEMEKEFLDDNAQAILEIITSSSDEKEWRTNVKDWSDKKFQLEKSNENTSSQWFLSDELIKRISSTMSGTNTRKQELIIEFKQKVEEMFQNERTEFSKYIDEQIQRLKIAAEVRRTDNPLHMTTSSASNTAMSLKSTIASLERNEREYFAKLRQEYDDIISELESTDIDRIPNRIEKWLKKHRDERMTCFKKLYEEHEEKQAQCLADDQSQMIKLSCCLNELAINSESAYKLREKLKDDEELMLKKHRELKLSQTKITVPVIVRQIDDPKVHKLSVCIRFDEDFDQWMKNAEKNKLDLTRSIEKQFDLPEKAFEIIAIEKGSIVCFGNINPPHGYHVYQRLMANGVSNIGGRDTVSVTLGDLNLNVEQEKMNRRYNRSYGNLVGDTHWIGSLIRGGRPYFCPKGWRRFGIKVAKTRKEFDDRWGDWHIAYHGTTSENAVAILQTGLKTNTGCFSKVQKVVYLSPSINYSAHYRYATPWKNPQQPGKYYQMIFQCRVNPLVMTPDKIKPQTLRCPTTVRIDEHFSNNEVEWLINPTTNGAAYINDNIICYGIMIRVVDEDPYNLPESAWWHHTLTYSRDYLNA